MKKIFYIGLMLLSVVIIAGFYVQRDENVKYNPPKPEDAPKEIREVVMYGHEILTHTQKNLPDNVGNELNCHSCHFEGGITQGGKNGSISYVGVATKYPKYRNRQDYSVDLMTRVNNCIMRSLNGDPLAPESKEMTAIITYLHWISKGVPIYAEIPWLGLKPLKTNHTPDKENGITLYENHCAKCHGDNGQGKPHGESAKKEGQDEKGKGPDEGGPPLWGNKSFTDGAGMSKLENFASFVHYNMPRHNPDLTEEQALDVAAYVTNQPRPKFNKDDKPW
jgi:thiosulfate dehydrogenase